MEYSGSHKNSFQFVIIDDDDITIFLAKRLIQQFNNSFQVQAFKDAREALAHFVKNGCQENEIILLDINMPLFTGWDFLDAFEKQQLKGNIFMFSSSIDKRDKEKAAAYAIVSGYISKPLTTSVLENILNAI